MEIDVGDVGSVIMEDINKYSDEVISNLEILLDQTADEIIDYIKSNAPRSGHSSNALADSFIKEVFGSGLEKRIVIYSKTKGGLVHLIEFGFTHRSGTKVSPRPFMRPAYDKFAPNMVEKMKEIIQGKKL